MGITIGISFRGRLALRWLYLLEVGQNGWTPRPGCEWDPGGFLPLHTSRSCFNNEGADRALGLGLLSPSNVLTQGDPCGKESRSAFGDNCIQCTILNYMPLTWLDKQPCPLPKDKGVALSVPQWLSQHGKPASSAFPHTKPPWEGKAQGVSSSVSHTGLWFSSLNKHSSHALLSQVLLSLSSSCSIWAPAVTMDPGLGPF